MVKGWIRMMAAIGLCLCLSASPGYATFIFSETPQPTPTVMPTPSPSPAPTPSEPPRDSIEYDEEAFRGIPWDASMEDVAEAEGGKLHTRTVTVTEDISLYGLTVTKLSYQFVDGVMNARVFEMKVRSKEAYSSLVYSTMLRYKLPFLLADRECLWQVGELNIAIERGDKLTVTFTRQAR